jgi:hypothetical protein
VFDFFILEMLPTYPHAYTIHQKLLSFGAMTLPFTISLCDIVDLQIARNALKLGE